MTFNAYAAARAKAALEPFQYEPEALRPGDVEIAISHCGICHSDVHLADGDWGDVFPLVPGHEIVGTVVAGPTDRIGQLTMRNLDIADSRARLEQYSAIGIVGAVSVHLILDRRGRLIMPWYGIALVNAALVAWEISFMAHRGPRTRFPSHYCWWLFMLGLACSLAGYLFAWRSNASGWRPAPTPERKGQE
jgi:hypothetical protein